MASQKLKITYAFMTHVLFLLNSSALAKTSEESEEMSSGAQSSGVDR